MTPTWIYYGESGSPPTRDWIPSDLSGTVLWYDAQDATTYTLAELGGGSGIDLDTWNEKIAGTFNLTDKSYIPSTNTVTYDATGINGLPCFRSADVVGAGDASHISTINNIQFDNDATLAVVFQSGDPNEFGQPDLNGTFISNARYQLRADNSPTRLTFATGTNRRDIPDMTQYNDTNYEDPHFVIWSYNNTAQTLTASFDGEIVIVNQAPGTIPSISSNTLRLWNRHQSTGGAGSIQEFCIGEVVVTNTLFSTTDFDLLNGYLAHHFGLEGNLPLAHPYKNSPPQI